MAGAGDGDPESRPVVRSVLEPLIELNEQYIEAGRMVAEVGAGLTQLAAQVRLQGAGATPAPPHGPATAPEATASRPARSGLAAMVEVRSRSIEQLLTFEEGLARIDGVESVSVVGSTTSGTRFLVHVAGGEAVERLTRICAWCGKLIEAGGPQVSHGLCADCAAKMLTSDEPL